MLSEVQAKEKERKKKEQQEQRARQKLEAQQKRRKAKRDIKRFNEICPKAKKGIIPRPILPRKAKKPPLPSLPSAYEVYVSLIDKLKTHFKDFEQQQSILEESGTVRWREHGTLGFQGKHLVNPGDPRIHKHYVQPKPKEAKYRHVVLDAKGPIDKGNPPFLGAHMVNDPTWIPHEETASSAPGWHLANCEFNEDFTLAAERSGKTRKNKLRNLFYPCHWDLKLPVYACWVGQTVPFATSHYGIALF
jgi:hypothetical protein